MLKASDLQDWREDPEVWSTQMEDTTESWEFLIRVITSCVRLFDAANQNYSHVPKSCLRT